MKSKQVSKYYHSKNQCALCFTNSTSAPRVSPKRGQLWGLPAVGPRRRCVTRARKHGVPHTHCPSSKPCSGNPPFRNLSQNLIVQPAGSSADPRIDSNPRD